MFSGYTSVLSVLLIFHPIQVQGAGGKKKIYVDKVNFDHTRSSFSKKFARLGCDEFVKSVTDELRRMTSSGTTSSTSSTSEYEFSDNDVAQVAIEVGDSR